MLLTGLLSKSEAVKRTAYVIFIIGAIGAAIASKTGEAAEEIVESTATATETFINRHEETAEIFTILSMVLAGLSLVGLWTSFAQKKFANGIAVLVLAYTIVVLYFAKQTGTTGGEIAHPEIRSQAVNTNTPPNKPEKDDDD